MSHERANETVTGVKRSGSSSAALSSGLIIVGLALSAAIVYGKVLTYPFVGFDDLDYISENAALRQGFSREGITWAFTTMQISNWHPLTWLSHMLDVKMFGLVAGGHHLVNLLFHMANSVLLFLVLKSMTGALWRSGFTAALFALHPLQVESVAWIAERKNVLSTFFMMLSLWWYARYAVFATAWRYLATLGCFALGLLSKPMLVTLPCVMLLLDFWPLCRLHGPRSSRASGGRASAPASAASLVAEKIPFFALSAISSTMTVIAQSSGGAVRSTASFPFSGRIANALVAYVSYLWKTIFPSRLAVFYPYPAEPYPAWGVAAAALLLGGLTVLFLWRAWRSPFLAVGWLWFTGTLVPVIGLVQVGDQALADRYMYVPGIGLFVALAWTCGSMLSRRPLPRVIVALCAGLSLALLSAAALVQVGHWRNSESLFRRAVAVVRDNHTAHCNLGRALEEQGRFDEAVMHYSEALRLREDLVLCRNNMANTLAKQGRYETAVFHFREALRLDPGNPDLHGNLGLALHEMERDGEAAWHYSEALRLQPDSVQVHINFGVLLGKQGRLQEARRHFERALEIDPGNEMARKNLELTRLLEVEAAPSGRGKPEE